MSHFSRATTFVGLSVLGTSLAAPPLFSAEPGRGRTGPFEIEYLEFIIDHHFSALRMTELAAGTEETRHTVPDPDEGTSPTPNMSRVTAKAEADALKSLARRNNRMQREEILTARSFLREWYGKDHEPALPDDAKAAIDWLERTPPGREFDHQFMEVLSRHHFMAVEPSIRCQVASELEHHELQRYCSNIVHSQISDIQDMREMLCMEFQICDYQPLTGMKGTHSSDE